MAVRLPCAREDSYAGLTDLFSSPSVVQDYLASRRFLQRQRQQLPSSLAERFRCIRGSQL